jgi:hypothetical protein
LGKEFVAKRTSGIESFATIWVVMVMATTTLLQLLPLLPCAHYLAPSINRKEKATEK